MQDMCMAIRKLGSTEERQTIGERLKSEPEGWKKERLIAVKMGMDPNRTLEEISRTVNRGAATVQRWFAIYKQSGLKGLLKRGYGKGRPSTMDESIQEFLSEGLKEGRWNTAKQTQDELEKQFKRKFKYKTVWYWLKKKAGVLRRPRPVHKKKDVVKAEAFKRNFLGTLKKLPLEKGKPVKVWFADESRYGLLPVIRRVWTLRGLRPHVDWKTQYQWSYCYGALDIVDGETVFLQTPSVNMDWTKCFLGEILKAYPGHEHVVVWDGAGFHAKTSEHWSVPKGIHLVALPPYSPELNPIEKLWDLIQDHTANKLWETIELLDEAVGKLLEQWWLDPRRVIRLVGKNWHRLSANAF
jgi:transposase